MSHIALYISRQKKTFVLCCRWNRSMSRRAKGPEDLMGEPELSCELELDCWWQSCAVILCCQTRSR